MGFIEEIEKRKQQAIQRELNRKAELERQQQIAVQKAAEDNRRKQMEVENGAQGFLKDTQIIISLVDQLYKAGYKHYFGEVSLLTGFTEDKFFYMEHPKLILGPLESVISMRERGSELTKQQIVATDKMRDTFSHLGWGDRGLTTWYGEIEGKYVKSPNTIFFGDKIVSKGSHRLVEPTEIGIGIRFLKQVKVKHHLNRLAEFLKKEHGSLVEKWYHAVYLRLDSRQGFTVTGLSQRQVELRDLKSLDHVLHQTFENPATVYSTHREIWEPPPKYPPASRGWLE